MHGKRVVRWRRWLLGGVATALVLVVGGPFAYFRFIQGKAPAALSITSLTTTSNTAGGGTSATAALTSLDGSFTVGAGSLAGYRVKETLFGQSATAVGRTTAVTGSLTISGATISKASVTVDLTKVSSDQSVRDSQFRGRIMNTDTYPTATFVLSQPIALGAIPADGVVIHPKATGKLTLHGVTRSVVFDLTAKRSGGEIDVNGSTIIRFGDYNVNNPSGGPATTGNSGTLEFLLVMHKA